MSKQNKCEFYKTLLVKRIDGEISPDEKQRLEKHLAECEECRKDFEQLNNWKGVSETMKIRLLPDMAWDEYWRHLYNRLERGIGWLLFSIGILIFLGLAAYHFTVNVLFSPGMGFLEKAGLVALVLGLVVLFVSVLREKLMTRKKDKYREIIR